MQWEPSPGISLSWKYAWFCLKKLHFNFADIFYDWFAIKFFSNSIADFIPDLAIFF